uniref:CWH43-like N-terminal domain-containing protein n=1 Tax=Plectus sambesii TaxID=2011161 RepID=A0A914V8D2_9BILA
MPSSRLPVSDAMPQPKHTHPLVMFPMRTIAIFGAFMPGFGCYAVIAYTYLFQMDRVKNFTSTDCPNVSSSLPPVSYSIGVWEPQRFFWLFILMGHVPPRLFFGALYYAFFASSNSIHARSSWYTVLNKIYA